MWQHERGYVRNRELQFYQEANARCVDGVLVITSQFDRLNLPYDTKPGAVTDPRNQMFHHSTLAPAITSASMVSARSSASASSTRESVSIRRMPRGQRGG